VIKHPAVNAAAFFFSGSGHLGQKVKETPNFVFKTKLLVYTPYYQ
jgi:hypothetical protein